MEINAHLLIPKQLLQVLQNLCAPLNCCADKIGMQQEAVFIFEGKSYCEQCIKKIAEEPVVELDLEKNNNDAQ